MSRSRRAWLPAFVLAAAAIASFLIEPRTCDERVVIAAVDAEAYAALAGRHPSLAGDLWERLKAMGVGAALLREETLGDLSARGEILHFTRAEVAKWRAAGLASPGSGLKGDSLWVKEPETLARVASALAAHGLDVSTSSVAGSRVFELPAQTDPALIPAGFDPAALAAVSSAGLIPIAVPSSNEAVVAGQRLWVRTLEADARREELLRAALGRPRRLLVFRLRAGQGLDASLDRLREALRVLRDSGLPSTFPAPRQPEREARAVRLFLIWGLAVLGPLLSVRAALGVSRWTRERFSSGELARQAAPVPEVLAGLTASAAVAALAGLIVAGIAPADWRDGSSRAWTLWAWCAPLGVAAVALFASEPSTRRRWSEPVTRRDLLAWLSFGLAAALLIAPRAALRASTLWEGFDRLTAVAGVLWWWPWRWREALLGVPALAVALVLVGSREAAADGGRPPLMLGDPKGWLLLGLLAPAGLLAAVGGSGAPLGATLVHGAVAHAVGAVLGAAAVAARDLLDRWVQGPKPNRTIDLGSMSES